MQRLSMTVFCTVLALCARAQSAQWLTAGNLSQDPVNDFLGNQDAVPMNIRTQDIRRFRLSWDETYTIGSFITQVKAGGLLLGGNVDGFYTNGGPGPFSALHLIEPNSNNAQALGYRPWMRNGITFTGNSDLGYIGHKYGVDANGALVNDRTDMVVHWSNDGNSQWGPDRLSFRFTSTSNGAVATGSPSWEGLEGMRLLPLDANNINVGIGDFVAGADDPTERLDVRTGRVRIRQLPIDLTSASNEFVTVNMTNGVLEHRPLGALPDNCEWTMNVASPNHVYTAVGGANAACPDASEHVGIGITQPVYKLDVFHDEAIAGITGGIRTDLRTNAGGWRDGILSRVQPSATSTTNLAFSRAVYADMINVGLASAGVADGYAVFARSTTDQNLFVRGSYGVYGDAVASAGTVTNLYGGYFSGRRTGGTVTNAYGVYCTATNATNNWAIWSQGNQFSSTGPAWQVSDENLKTDVEDIQGAMERLMQLRPKTYRFRTDEYPYLQLAEEPQFGLLAQNMAEVLPNLVKDVHRPADVDSSGAEIAPAIDFKAVKYDGLIPLLIAAVQEQQGHIAAMEQRTAALEEMLASCCATRDAGALPEGTSGISAFANDLDADRKLRIVPNPFSEPPTVYYTLDRGGRMQLIANSADGKELNVLQEATLQAGEYQYEWNTTNLAPGTYYVTLLVDGQPLVKKAVKVTR